MAVFDNQLSYWYSGQLVTAAEMTSFSEDIYARFTDLTQTLGNVPQIGLILNIDGISQIAGNVTLGAGSFRFPDTNYSFLPYNTGIYGNADTAVVAVTGNGFIVARYVANPTSGPTFTQYTFATTYEFVATIDVLTDCLICTITAGVISGYGRFNVLYDIIDNPITGEVLIGSSTVKSGQKQMYIANAPISGDTPNSYLNLFLNGLYTEAQILSTNGIVNNSSALTSTYTDPGNGIFKPYISTSVSDPVGYAANFSAGGMGPAGYEGFISEMYNQINPTDYAVMQMYPDAGSPFSAWYLSIAAVNNTGFQLEENIRPTLMGNLATLAKPVNAVTVFNDFPVLLDANNQYQELASGTQMQAGTATIPASSSQVTVTLLVPFANKISAVTANPQSGTDLFLSTYWTSATQFTIFANLTVSGDREVSYIAMGY